MEIFHRGPFLEPSNEVNVSRCNTLVFHWYVGFQVSPLPPMRLEGAAVYMSNTLNWLAALPLEAVVYENADDIELVDYELMEMEEKLLDIDPYLIVSFDLGKEKYAQLSLPYCPRRRDELNDFVPILGVLRGCLCISQNSKETHNFMLWQMKEFGVYESWILLFNIIVDEKILHLPCLAMCMSENDDALLFAKSGASQAVLYHRRAKKLEGTKIVNNIVGSDVKNYIESLVSPS
ncbi:uncharacterized protein LOC130719197 [Lotus japonicus]|uniref:uncharacterized protein LOC130719197 n=1 Tax=Lotus japonicus TaxID=34305 RepID=UPI0025835232|nr:uncharacterized protein LOC130719197 [Lotus japonicus]